MIKSLGGNDMKKLILLLMIMLFSIAGIPDVHSYSLIIIPHRDSLDVSGSPATVSFDIVFHGLLSPPNATAPNISNDITLATVVFDINTAAADGNDDVLLDKNNKIHFLLNGTPVPTSAITVVAGVDYDGDGIFDDGDGSGNAGDNRCTGGNANSCDDNYYLSSNAGQPDKDNDGYGNVCDCDLDNDGVVGFNDYSILGNAWGSNSTTSNWNPDADFDSDGVVGFHD